jgi:hypothetical protein
MIKLSLYLIWSGGSAISLLAIEAAVDYHRASPLPRYYVKYVGYISGGVHKYLNAFWKLVSFSIQIFTFLILAA